jgi:hypothetical protein
MADKTDTALAEKKTRAKRMSKNTPAKIRDLDGQVQVITEADIELMDENEVDATISTILQQRRDGSRPKYPNVNALQDAINGYWKHIVEERRRGIDIYPDVEGACSYLNVARSTLMSWKNQNVNGFGETIEQLFTNIAAVKKQIAMHGNMPALIFMADFNNNHGYINTAKMEVQQTNATAIPDATSLLEQIRNLPDNDDNA